MKKMTKEEFLNEVQKILNNQELLLLNFNIYMNEEHINYYMDFHSGKYSKCLNYIKKNKHLLQLDHTPEQFKEIAKRTLGNFDNNQNLKGLIRVDFDHNAIKKIVEKEDLNNVQSTFSKEIFDKIGSGIEKRLFEAGIPFIKGDSDTKINVKKSDLETLLNFQLESTKELIENGTITKEMLDKERDFLMQKNKI